MSTTQTGDEAAAQPSGPTSVALRFEVTVLSVSDVDRAKAFSERLGWRMDADLPIDEHFRIVQLTPPGSPASIQFGLGMTTQPPGTSQSLYLIVDDIEAARQELASFADPDGNTWLLQQIRQRLPGRD